MKAATTQVHCLFAPGKSRVTPEFQSRRLRLGVDGIAIVVSWRSKFTSLNSHVSRDCWLSRWLSLPISYLSNLPHSMGMILAGVTLWRN